MEYKPKEVIQFDLNKPVTVTLDNSPAFAKRKEKEFTSRTGDTYMRAFWILFTADDKVFFPNDTLYNKLVSFNKGDTFTITKIDYNDWEVTTEEGTTAPGAPPLNIINQKELKEIEERLDSLENRIKVLEPPKEDKDEEEKTNTKDTPF